MDKKIRFAKTLAWLLLKQSYERKNRVALLAFRGGDAQVLAPPTPDVTKIEESLEKLPTGGKTPLTPALHKAFELAKKETKARPTIILISDGRGNVFIKDSQEEDTGFNHHKQHPGFERGCGEDKRRVRQYSADQKAVF